jgi:uncharacterized membrane protein YbhN (UPF0104 family)
MILLAVIAVFFYFQFIKIDWSKEKIQLIHPFYLILTLLLLPMNWFLEWIKWVITLNIAEVQTTQKIKLNAFFAGIITGMLTPNMLGNFIGRIYYFERRNRISLIVLTLVSNYAQFIASIVFGIIGILILRKIPVDFEINKFYFLLIVIGLVVILFYFNFEWFFKFLKRKARIHLLIRNIKRRRMYRWKTLLLSFLRHGIFTLQFSFMLHAFGENLSLENVFWIWQVYLWVTIAPSLILGKLAIRESIAIWVLTLAGMGELTVLISSFLIWTFNLLLPTIIGLFICKEKR